MSRVLTREQVLKAMGLAQFRQNAAFAGGGRLAAPLGKYIPLDLPTHKATYMLSADGALSLSVAAAAVRDNDAIFRGLIEDVEDEGLAQQPPHEQTFFIIAGLRAGGVLVDGGKPDKALTRLAARAPLSELRTIQALSIQRLLREVRENAVKAGLKLPRRFTMPRSDPGYPKWAESLAARRRSADVRCGMRVMNAERRAQALCLAQPATESAKRPSC